MKPFPLKILTIIGQSTSTLVLFNLMSSLIKVFISILIQFAPLLDAFNTITQKTNATVIPRDYFVPNFGKDNDVVGTANSLNIAEK